MLAALPVFAAHTYRAMPFVLTPLLWDAYSRPFRSSSAADPTLERAHGDGMKIGFDTPEAFEEVVWRTFWPEKYRHDRILPWAADDQDARGEFERFFRSHIAKVVLLGKDDGAPDGTPRRYLSKNNANVARVPKLKRLFPDAVVVVPFRNPVAQALSMHRQHANFSEMHAASPFARRYMADLGHFEFGANLRPIDFDARPDAASLGGASPRGAGPARLDASADVRQAARDPNFWLRYWCSAYQSLLAQPDAHIAPIGHDALRADPAGQLARLGAVVGLDDPSSAAKAAGRIRKPAPVQPDARSTFQRDLLADADGIYDALLARSAR